MKRFKITDLLVGFIFTLLFISIGVVLTVNFRPLYYMDIKLLHIEAFSGLVSGEIIKNYNALINYCSPFFRGNLVFPSLTASESGLSHFAEVKDIFTDFYILGAITLVLGIIIIIKKAKNKDYNYLLVSAITAIVLPMILGLIMLIDFDRTFILFHRIFFKNNDWLFDPVTDPVINILPETFFMHCAILIIIIVLLFSTAFFLIYVNRKKHFSIKNRKNRGLKL
jgi:integral membrane protein (TIGR01906 family)